MLWSNSRCGVTYCLSPCPEDGGSRFPESDSEHVPDYTVLSRRPHSKFWNVLATLHIDMGPMCSCTASLDVFWNDMAALSVLISALYGDCVASSRLNRFIPDEEPPVYIGQETGWVPQPVLSLWNKEKSVACPLIELRFVHFAAYFLNGQLSFVHSEVYLMQLVYRKFNKTTAS
jgi:hypothetical protein